jgi:hypothetical protein
MGLPPTSTNITLGGSLEPTFVIKCGDVYYVTQSVAPYDPAKATTQAQREDVERIRKLFDDARKAAADCCDCVKLPPENNVLAFQHTGDDD